MFSISVWGSSGITGFFLHLKNVAVGGLAKIGLLDVNYCPIQGV